MAPSVRGFLLTEAVTFIVAALAHLGILVRGYEHTQAGVAEGVIAAVLLSGLTMTWITPRIARQAGFGAQLFALLGTLVGVFTIAIGVGPRTVPDIAYHVGILAVLVLGVMVAREPASAAARPPAPT